MVFVAERLPVPRRASPATPRYRERDRARRSRRINERWGTDGLAADRARTSRTTSRASVALLRRADVLLVNPIRDGLNLVASEAALVNERDAVLALSPEAGAWERLHDGALARAPLRHRRHRRRAPPRAHDARRRASRPRRHASARIAEARTPADWLADQLAAAGPDSPRPANRGRVPQDAPSAAGSGVAGQARCGRARCGRRPRSRDRPRRRARSGVGTVTRPSPCARPRRRARRARRRPGGRRRRRRGRHTAARPARQLLDHRALVDRDGRVELDATSWPPAGRRPVRPAPPSPSAVVVRPASGDAPEVQREREALVLDVDARRAAPRTASATTSSITGRQVVGLGVLDRLPVDGRTRARRARCSSTAPRRGGRPGSDRPAGHDRHHRVPLAQRGEHLARRPGSGRASPAARTIGDSVPSKSSSTAVAPGRARSAARRSSAFGPTAPTATARRRVDQVGGGGRGDAAEVRAEHHHHAGARDRAGRRGRHRRPAPGWARRWRWRPPRPPPRSRGRSRPA